MKEFLITTINHLSNNGWIADAQACVEMYEKHNIKGFFAERDNYTCFFTIENLHFSCIIFKNR